MRRWWQILVLGLAIASLLTPASAICTLPAQAGHECCAPQSQLSAVSCCLPGEASQSAIPASSAVLSAAEFAPCSSPLYLAISQPPVRLRRALSISPPILLPATILRT
ncbi:MAG TPA: hypothetical protein VHZ52_15620 [Acidobacteriaceae bacterium]|nr:hypothetical protein [Acidobacteriaceae bacterium]